MFALLCELRGHIDGRTTVPEALDLRQLPVGAVQHQDAAHRGVTHEEAYRGRRMRSERRYCSQHPDRWWGTSRQRTPIRRVEGEDRRVVHPEDVAVRRTAGGGLAGASHEQIGAIPEGATHNGARQTSEPRSTSERNCWTG